MDGDFALDHIPDPEIYQFLRRSVAKTQQPTPNSSFHNNTGQVHLLYKQQQAAQRNGVAIVPKLKAATTTTVVKEPSASSASSSPHEVVVTTTETEDTETTAVTSTTLNSNNPYPTRLLVRRHAVRSTEEGVSGTHIYAVRWGETDDSARDMDDDSTEESDHLHLLRQEQCPRTQTKATGLISTTTSTPQSKEDREPTSSSRKQQLVENPDQILSVDHLFRPSTIAAPPKRKGGAMAYVFSMCVIVAGIDRLTHHFTFYCCKKSRTGPPCPRSTIFMWRTWVFRSRTAIASWP